MGRLKALGTGAALGAACLLLVSALHGRILPGWQARQAQTALDEFARGLDQLRERSTVGGPAISVRIGGHDVSVRAVSRYVIEMHGLPCEVAQAVEDAIDDGLFPTGKVVASVPHCTVGGENDPVPSVVVALPR